MFIGKKHWRLNDNWGLYSTIFISGPFYATEHNISVTARARVKVAKDLRIPFVPFQAKAPRLLLCQEAKTQRQEQLSLHGKVLTELRK